MSHLQLPHLTSLLLATALWGCAAEGGGSDPDGAELAPSLLPISDSVVRVGETVRIEVGVDNPGALPLTWSWDAPPLPGLQSALTLGGTPGGGELVYAPLASHVGTREFVVRIGSTWGEDAAVARVEVQPSGAAAPVFVRPGPGGTFDLARDPCVVVPIEIRDDDSLRVEVSLASGPDGATLHVLGAKQAELRWCPSAAQIGASTRHPFDLEASDGVHGATPHRYTAVLLVPAKEGCAGEPPVVSFVSPAKGEEVRSGRGYSVVIDVIDDVGLRDAPVLYWGTTPPEDEDAPDLTEFAQEFFAREGERWVARVPSLGLAPGEERVVWAVATATDNDDAEGTACDQTSRSEVLRFVAVGAPAEAAADCDVCVSAADCGSGLCGLIAGGARCLPACEASCGSDCAPVTSSAGVATRACGDPATLCGGGASDCVDDELEPNDAQASAVSIGVGSLDAAICGDEDWYRLPAAPVDRVRVVLDGFVSGDGDLDLALFALDGRLLAQSAGVEDREEAAVCAPPDGAVLIRVLGYDGATNPYRLTAERTGGSCCENDAGEPDNTVSTGQPVQDGDLVEGVLCAGDEDWFVFDASAATSVAFDLIFDSDAIDIDVDLHGPDGRIVASSRTIGDERIEHTTVSAGRYGLRVYGYGSSDVGSYVGELSLETGGCTGDGACGVGRRCVGGVCVDATCRDDSGCRDGEVCTVSEPEPAGRICRVPCAVNADCGDGACKWFPEGRACGARGAGANGDACTGAADCGGQRACVAWTSGYCARAGCRSNADCEPGTWCSDVYGDGERLCVLDCLVADDICRLAEGYTCDLIEDTDGEPQLGCVGR